MRTRGACPTHKLSDFSFSNEVAQLAVTGCRSQKGPLLRSRGSVAECDGGLRLRALGHTPAFVIVPAAGRAILFSMSAPLPAPASGPAPENAFHPDHDQPRFEALAHTDAFKFWWASDLARLRSVLSGH